MVVRAEQILNAAETTLNGSINDSTTSVTVTDGSVYPSTGNWRVIVGIEIMIVTARATNVFTVVRAAEGTAAASHEDEETVITIITKGGLDQYVKDFIDPMAFDRPPNQLLDKAGNTLTKSDFTELNMGTGTVTDDAGGGITIAMQQGAAPNLRAIYKSAPATPWKMSAHILSSIFANGATENANLIGFRESSSGNLSFISYHYGSPSLVEYLDDPTTTGPASSATQNAPSRADYWLQIEHDGTDLFYRLSSDGFNWWELHTEDDAFHFTSGPDGIIWGGDNQGTDGQFIHLLAWVEETP